MTNYDAKCNQRGCGNKAFGEVFLWCFSRVWLDARTDAAVAMVSNSHFVSWTSAQCVHVIRNIVYVLRRTWAEEAFVVPLSKLSKRDKSHKVSNPRCYIIHFEREKIAQQNHYQNLQHVVWNKRNTR